jgi:diguanylate cyclase (GGDEF)-like protein
MSKKVVFTLLDGIEEVALLLDELPELTYILKHAEPGNLCTVIEKNLPHIMKSEDNSFVIVLSRKHYYGEAKERSVAKLMTSSGIKAEPIFLVVDKNFTWKDIDHIIHHNNLFYVMPTNRRQLLTKKNINTFRGLIDKAILDFNLNSKLIDLISNEFMSFIEKEELKLSKEEIEQLNMELETKNRVDELTRLLNRKGIFEYFHMAKGRATRERWRLKAQNLNRDEIANFQVQPEGDIDEFFGHLSCMMIDIDNFKKVNDTFGHIVGDEVLRGIGSLFIAKGIFRQEDVCGRFGGEEFIVILPATNAEHAINPAEKLRKTIESKTFESAEGEPFTVTVSIGVAELEESEETIEDLINKADIALYEAKQTGKNRTVIYQPGRMSKEAVANR